MDRYVAQAVRDAILGTPRDLLRAGQGGVSLSTKALAAGKTAGATVVDYARRLASGLKNLVRR